MPLENRRDFLKTFVASGAALGLGRLAAANAPTPNNSRKPNILVILADDLGFSDLSCYGSEIHTPNLDQLAANGLRFTQFYNMARCCPSRATLLTGLYAHQTAVGHMKVDNGEQFPGYRGRLNDSCVTIAEVLNGAGYFTAMTGKWHLGQMYGVTPKSRGFQRSLNSIMGGFYFSDNKEGRLFLDGQAMGDNDPAFPKDWYATDLWTDFGVKFIDEALAAKQPFFLYLAHNAPHFPLQAPPEDIARFRGKYLEGWDNLREQRRAKQIELGIMDKSWPLSPREPEVKAWDSLSDEEKGRFDQIMAIYAAAVSRIDQNVDRLVAALRERNALDDTLILFLSDNGGCAETGPEGVLSGKEPGSAHSRVVCGQSWATLQNTPLRLYKHYDHEGGVSTPLIVHWPARVAAKGELRSQQGHIIDIMPTCLDVAGATYPREFNGNPILPMEGLSLLPAFANEPLPCDALYWEHEGNAAMRAGDWKLVRKGAAGEWELYDMKADRTELHNLAAEQPDRVKELAAKWQAWAERAHVLPRPGGGAAAGQKKSGAGEDAEE